MNSPKSPSTTRTRHQAWLATRSALLFLTLTTGTVWLVYWLLRNAGLYLSSVPKELAAALVAGMVTVLVATLTIVVGKYFERKKELDALYRDKKTEIYDDFLKRFFQIFHSPGSDKSEDLVAYLRDFSRKTLLWSGPEVVENFLAWKAYAASGKVDARMIFIIEDFILSIRRDLRHSNRGIRKGIFARMLLRNGEIFLQMAEKNPDISLGELAAIEKALEKSAGQQKENLNSDQTPP